MSQKERQNDILDILKRYGYVSVKVLTEELHYSSATINRDLNHMETQGLVKRSYGGVELVGGTVTPLAFRYHKMRVHKNHIGLAAAGYIEDGDTVFIDGSTTGQYIGRYITGRKDLTVISNNMALVTFLSEYGVNAICLGGRVVEVPSMVCSPETVENVRSYHADKVFFSTGGITHDGRILSDDRYYLMHKAMLASADRSFYMADHGKVDTPNFTRFLCDAGDVDVILSDHAFSSEVQSRYPDTAFVKVEV